MKNYTFVMLESAEIDLVAITDYIAMDNITIAIEWAQGLRERAQVLSTPFEQSLPPEALELLREAQKRGGMGETKPLAHHGRCAKFAPVQVVGFYNAVFASLLFTDIRSGRSFTGQR